MVFHLIASLLPLEEKRLSCFSSSSAKHLYSSQHISVWWSRILEEDTRIHISTCHGSPGSHGSDPSCVWDTFPAPATRENQRSADARSAETGAEGATHEQLLKVHFTLIS